MSDFKAKMHQIQIPDPAGGAYSASSDPIAVFKEPTSKGGMGGIDGKREGGE